MSGLDVLFVLASIVTVGSAVLVVTRRNPVYSAAWMMASLFGAAVVYLLLHSSFVFVIQVLLYAGAILVLFLFVIMLLNPGPEDLRAERAPALQRGIAWALALLLFVLVAGAVGAGRLGSLPAFSDPAAARPAADFGTTAYFGRTIYDAYLVPFEVISLLIVAAIAGVVVLAKRRIEEAEVEEGAPPARRRPDAGPGSTPRRELEEIVHH
jgi:NADH-quinone oxidoreductase subunit J